MNPAMASTAIAAFFLKTSFGGAVTGLLILLFRAIFGDKLSCRLKMLLWLMLFLRLTLPNFPASPLSVFNLFRPVTEVLSITEDVKFGFAVIPGNTLENDSVPKSEKMLSEKEKADTESGKGSESVKVFSVLLLSAQTLLLVAFTAVYFVFLAKVKRRKPCESPETLRILFEAKEKAGAKRAVEVREYGTSPLLCGIASPTILLPKGLSENEKRDIFLHELIHQKHGDNILMLFSALLCLLHFFNPVVWICRNEFAFDLEMRCDDEVLRHCQSRADYAEMLLGFASGKKGVLSFSAAFAGEKHNMKRRIKHMAKKNQNTKKSFVLPIALAALLALACLTGAAAIGGINGDDSKAETENKAENQTEPELSFDNEAPVSPVEEAAEEGTNTEKIPQETVPDTGPADGDAASFPSDESEAENFPDPEGENAASEPIFVTVPAMIRPCGGEISQSFGKIGERNEHLGTDYALQRGDDVFAACNGTVAECGYLSTYGNAIRILHEDGVETFYAHLSEILVDVEETVEAGQIIGKAGATGAATGPHLHFEIRTPYGNVDPETVVNG